MASPNPQWRVNAFAAIVLTVVLAAAGIAQDSNDNDWQALALQRGLSDADVQQLDTDRILITNQAYKQIYEAYPNGWGPSFITSDSLLNAYHVLYEESILRLEQAGAQRLPEILRFVLANLDTACAEVEGQAELVAAAKQRASIVVGTALSLLDDEFVAADETIMTIIDDEVAKVVAAAVMMKPDWLGPPEPNSMALDYTRYKVRGFYTKSETLTRYFRAVAWLQSIPFRVSYDDELLSILILGRCLAPDRFRGEVETYEAYRNYFRTYTEFLGVGDDWDLITAADAVVGEPAFDLDTKRAELMAQAQQEGGPQINDQLRFAPEDPNAVAEPNFRIVSAYRLPESVLFRRTTDIRQFEARPFPNGLEVCIALGSNFARERIGDAEKDKLLATIDENLGLFAGTSLYFDYLNAIVALLDAPEPNAPPFMAAEPWQAKSCGTALAGWAQLRHTWVLQAKEVVYSSGLSRKPKVPAGFVEPAPEFFGRMAELAARTNDLLCSAGAFEDDRFLLIGFLTDVADLLEQAGNLNEFASQFSSLPGDTQDRLWYAYRFAKGLEGDKQARVEYLRRMAEDLGQGIMDPSLYWLAIWYDADVGLLWPSLEETSLQLESIARKQLDGVEISAEDDDFIKAYGGRLQTLMFYRGEALDTAPKVCDVFSNSWAGGNLHVGISRARALYVLYPWDGDFVLCRGAVMPYYEFVDGARLTDTEWKDRLDSDVRPDVPSWLRPIIGAEGLTAPVVESATGR